MTAAALALAGAVAVPAVAGAAHAVICHHAHLAALNALYVPVYVPPERPGSWWHGLGRLRQAAMIAAMAAAGALCGLAWAMSPAAAAASVTAAVAGLVIWLAARPAAGRK